MRALTLHQPYAHAIAVGHKTVETRSWKTGWRGHLAIHAGLTLHRHTAHALGWWPERLALGAIVAISELVHMVPTEHVTEAAPLRGGWHYFTATSTTGQGDEPADLIRTETLEVGTLNYSLGDYTPGRYAWVLRNIERLRTPIRTPGRQGLWKPDPDLEAEILHTAKKRTA